MSSEDSNYDAEAAIKNTDKKVDEINKYMVGIVIVTAFGFVTLLFTVVSLVLTYQRDNSNSYTDYRNELRDQNSKIDDLTNELKLEREKRQVTP